MSARSLPGPGLTLAEDRSSRPKERASLGRGRRFAELARIARRNGLLPWRKLDFTTDLATADLRAEQAEGLRRALEQAGGAFVKLGQVLSTRSDLLPHEYVTALSHLQRDVAPAPWADVRAMLETEFGAPLDEVFLDFDSEPVAAASIGQVHRATLPSGRTVAVKILRPGIAPEVERDVDIALRFVSFIDRTSAQARMLGIRQVAEQYGADLVRQLDFRLEALNLTALRAMQARGGRSDDIRLPELVESLSSERVLVMEFLEGDTITAINKRPGPVSAEVAPALRSVLRSFVRQIVFDGIYHSDLHPGNIMILPDGQPALVDFGSVGRLDLQLRESVQELLIAYLQSDNQLIADGLLTLARLREGADEEAFRRELSAFVAFELGPGARISVATVDAAVAIFVRYGMSVPAELIAAGRGFAVLEGSLRSTLPDFDILEEARALAAEQIRDQMSPRRLRETLTTELLALLPGVRRLPRRIDRIGHALETGDLNVNIRLLADHRDRRLLRGLIRQLSLTVVGVVAGVSSVGYLTTPAPAGDVAVQPAVAGLWLGIGAIVAFAAAGIDALRGRRR